MPKKLAKRVVKQAFELPGQVAREAGEQTGVFPKKEEGEPELTKEELEKRAAKEKVKSLKEAAKIEAELTEMVEKRKEEMQLRRTKPKPPEEKETKKTLAEPQSKKPRGLLAALKARRRKTPEKAAGKVSG